MAVFPPSRSNISTWSNPAQAPPIRAAGRTTATEPQSGRK
jgi:hypothetical protein